MKNKGGDISMIRVSLFIYQAHLPLPETIKQDLGWTIKGINKERLFGKGESGEKIAICRYPGYKGKGQIAKYRRLNYNTRVSIAIIGSGLCL